MANFSTHMLGAVGVGIVVSSVLVTTGLLPLSGLATGVGLVALGGIFPDVDSDHSDAIDLVFSTLAVGVAAPVMIAAVPSVGLLAALVLLAVTYAAVRYVVIVPFRWFTAHRGRFHSLPTAALLGAIVAITANRGLGLDPVGAWIHGALFVVGYLVHLGLDEIYSVDLGNRRIARSFGTALKLGDRHDLVGYGILYAAIAVCLAVAPPTRPFADAIASVEIRLLPPQSVLDVLASVR